MNRISGLDCDICLSGTNSDSEPVIGCRGESANWNAIQFKNIFFYTPDIRSKLKNHRL